MLCLPRARAPRLPAFTNVARKRRGKGSLAGRLVGCTRGGPIIEFAMVAPAAIALLLAVLHVALIYLAQEGLETAAETSARLIMTGQVQQAAMSQSDFKAAACKALPPFLACNRLYVDVTTTNSFSSAVTGAPKLNYNSSGSVTNAFSYIPGSSNATANSTQIVVLRLVYLWPVATGPLGFNLADQPNGNHTLLATSVLMTENY